MGQFGNQPDFGTQGTRVHITGDGAHDTAIAINPPCALYIGTGGDLLVNIVGGNDGGLGPMATLFKNVPSGTFMPVMVSNVWLDYDGDPFTTANDIIGLR